MKVRVQFTSQLRTALGRAAEEVELPDGSSALALLEHLATKVHGAAPHLLAANGLSQRGLLIVINETAVAAEQAATIQLRPGDTVSLLPPIAGG
jgi:molybdopterin converting factor small subunit